MISLELESLLLNSYDCNTPNEEPFYIQDMFSICSSTVLNRSPEFSDFLRKALDKNVDNRLSALQLLQVGPSCIS